MLKHVQISPLRSRSDSLSLRSTTSCASSLCGSPEPPSDLQRTPSRASSYSSLNEAIPQTTIKVFTNCLRIDIEYKTLGIQWDTSSKEVVAQLLKRLKMRHRDPRLFFLSMEVTVRSAGFKTVLVLDDAARPAILQACHPKGDSRFCLQLKPGGLIRIHTSALQSSSQYKSLVISQETTSDELLCILLSCYNSVEPVEQFSLYEVCPGQEYQRKLHPDDIPLKAQSERIQRGETCHFLVRRNPNYPKRRQAISTTKLNVRTKAESHNQNFNNQKMFDLKASYLNDDSKGNEKNLSTETMTLSTSIKKSDSQEKHSESQIHIENNELKFQDQTCSDGSSTFHSATKENKQNQKHSFKKNTIISFIPVSTSLQYFATTTSQKTEAKHFSNINIMHSNNSVKKPNLILQRKQHQSQQNTTCQKCENSFKSCEFCNKDSKTTILNTLPETLSPSSIHSLTDNLGMLQNSKNSYKQEHHFKNLQMNKYSPVYNIREIRTVSHSFSSFGNDKKILDIDFKAHFIPLTSSLSKASCSSKEQINLQQKVTTLKIPVNSTPNIQESNKKTLQSTDKNNHSPVLTLTPFTNKYHNFSKTTNTSCFAFNDLPDSIKDINCNLISVDQSKTLKTENISKETNFSNEKEKNNMRSIEEVNNNPPKGLGHFVYI